MRLNRHRYLLKGEYVIQIFPTPKFSYFQYIKIKGIFASQLKTSRSDEK